MQVQVQVQVQMQMQKQKQKQKQKQMRGFFAALRMTKHGWREWARAIQEQGRTGKLYDSPDTSWSVERHSRSNNFGCWSVGAEKVLKL